METRRLRELEKSEAVKQELALAKEREEFARAARKRTEADFSEW